jgi:putative DNA methylase
MPRLAAEGVVGADAIFACLGPALEIFSRYSRVEKVSGERVTLKEYLEQVWAAVSREALSMIFEGADATGFEPDARLTAMWLWTLSTTENGGAPAESEDEDTGDDEDAPAAKGKMAGGYVLEYDAVRKIAQGLGGNLDALKTVVEIKGDKARLLSVAERAGYLFGKAQTAAPARPKKKQQLAMFEEAQAAEPPVALGLGDLTLEKVGETTLDRVHQAMLLFGSGRGDALKRFLAEEGAGKDARFWRLAQALSQLYPAGTDERRLVDGVQARKKGLGL